ncbi:MAG: ATPase, T2SS/T4P/T4SS family [Kofleriaceae bacterium]
MAKIDPYLRSIEKFGAAGAVLTSGQPITLKFAAGDRNATQVVGHDQLVQMVREIAPPQALELIDGSRPARFDYDSNQVRYTVTVSPKPGVWQVVLEAGGAGAAGAAAAAPASVPARAARVQTAPALDAGDLAIERGQYAEDSTTAAPATSGSTFLDAITHAARGMRASDVVLTTGAAPLVRTNGALEALPERGALDAETLSRELGIVAPAEARGAWTGQGSATFTYGDGMGRVRVTLSRDHRGPGATLRLLIGEAPAYDRLGLPREVGAWLDRRGLVIVAGAAGSGKTTTLAALVKALGDRRRRVIAIEDPIELVHASPWVSQRAVGEHVDGIAAGVAAAVREGADAIAVGAITAAEDAVAVIDAVAAGQLVLATLATTADRAADHLVAMLPLDRRELGKAVIARGFLGAVAGVVEGGNRRFEVVARSD